MLSLDSDGISVEARELAILVDRSGTVRDANDRFLGRIGRQRDEVVGTNVAAGERFVADGMDALQTAIEAVLDGASSYDQCHVVLDTDTGGPVVDRVPVRARITPVVDDGSVSGALVTCRPDDESAVLARDLEEAYQRYETLVEESRDGVTITQDGTNVFVNARFAGMLGYERSELVGESVLKPIAPEDYETVSQRHRERLRGESPPNRYDLTLETKRGRRVPVEINVNRIDYEGEPAVLATFRDITQQRSREEKLSRFRRAIETAPHAIFLTEKDGTITYVNPAFEETTGYTKSEALGATPGLFQADKHDDSFYTDLWETILDGDVWEGYMVNERTSGEYYHAHETIAPIPDENGDIKEFVAIQTDISQRVERERLVNTFDRVLRHNLRNRLNVIESHGSLIQEQTDRDIDGHVEKILDSVDSLLETTQKGRQIVKLLSQPSHSNAVDIAAVVRTVVESVETSYPESDITVDVPESAHITAVAEIEDCLTELLENSIEHSDRPTPNVSVRVAVADDIVRVRVADDGPGISEMERQILDETADIDQLYHGSGFGLWLVYWVVRRSDGTIAIADRTPRGTEVTLEFPRLRGSVGTGEDSSQDSTPRY